jgi:ketosteroid isomerase-like protein
VTTVNEIDASIAGVVEAYKSAIAARNIEALMGLYDQAVRIFDAWGIWSYEDAAAWRIAVEGWFATHPADRFDAIFEDVSTVSTPAFASLSAIVTYSVVSPEGVRLNSMQNRLTWVLEKGGHDFRIVHEHTSAPIGFEDQKAILQRAREP